MKYERVLLLEDDPLQGDTIFHFLVQNLGAQVELLRTESRFHRYLDEIRIGDRSVPDIIISDIMMPWAWPGENTDIPVPDSVREGTYRRAGVRCRQLFRDCCSPPFGTASVPWIYFSVLGREDIEPSEGDEKGITLFVTKEQGLECLLAAITSLPGY